jgi:hypothetical protein
LTNKNTALDTNPVSRDSVAAVLSGRAATLERFRVDRRLDEALPTGAGPLHLAEVFNLAEKTAIRYASAARALSEAGADRLE